RLAEGTQPRARFFDRLFVRQGLALCFGVIERLRTKPDTSLRDQRREQRFVGRVAVISRLRRLRLDGAEESSCARPFTTQCGESGTHVQPTLSGGLRLHLDGNRENVLQDFTGLFGGPASDRDDREIE